MDLRNNKKFIKFQRNNIRRAKMNKVIAVVEYYWTPISEFLCVMLMFAMFYFFLVIASVLDGRI